MPVDVYLHVIEEVQLEALVPVEVEPAGAHNSARLVDVVHLDHAVQVPESLVPPRRLQTSTFKKHK